MKLSDQLKESVIYAAITGHLVLQKEGEDAHKELSTLHIDEIYNDEYEIPDNWALSYLEQLTVKKISRGKSPKYVKESNILAFAQKCNLKSGGISLEKAKYFDEKKAAKYSNEEFLHDNDIVINSTGGGTLGRVGIFHSSLLKNGMSIIPDSHITTIRINPYFNYKYFYLYLKFKQTWLETMGVGSTNQTELKPQVLKEMIISVPPLAEQHRIVEKVDALMAEIDELEKKENELEKLEKEFPEDMKDSLLQAGMMGELTGCQPNSTESYSNVFEISGGSQPSKSYFIETPQKEYVRLYQTRDYGDKPIPVYIPKKFATKQTKEGDILLARYGGSLGKVFIAHDGAYNVAMVKVIQINPGAFLNKFIYYYHLSSAYQDFCRKVSNGRSAQAGFNKDDIASISVNVFPIEEQQRIVDKLDELLPLVDKLAELN